MVSVQPYKAGHVKCMSGLLDRSDVTWRVRSQIKYVIWSQTWFTTNPLPWPFMIVSTIDDSSCLYSATDALYEACFMPRPFSPAAEVLHCGFKTENFSCSNTTRSTYQACWCERWHLAKSWVLCKDERSFSLTRVDAFGSARFPLWACSHVTRDANR